MRHVLKLVLALLTAAAMTGVFAAGASGVTAHPAVGGRARTAAAVTAAPIIACDQLASHDFSDVPDAPAVILSATQVTPPAPAPAVCQVAGYVAPQEQFQLVLPVGGYTGRYLQQGCGGLCGLDFLGAAGPGRPKGSAAPASAAGCTTVAAAAAASGAMAIGIDNQGHIGGETDGLWARDDPALRVSFGYASEHALAQAAKAIITAYYGKPPAYSYYNGCSGGGHEALVEAQRYPRDFNGILAGAPGNIEAQLLGVVPAWVIAVNTGSDGREILTSEKLPALHTAVVKACGARGLIEDPRSCDFNPATIRCPAGTDNSSCLTAAQVTVVRDFYLGPNDGHGHYLYPGGEPYGSELAWDGRATDPSSDTQWPRDTFAYQLGTNYLKYMGYWHSPPASFQLSDFRFTLADYGKLLPLADIYDATDPDLSAFQRAGGKLILYQGWADEKISPFGTVDYYKTVVQDARGFTASQAFTRLYMIPGQYHCLNGGSPAVDAQQATNELLNSLMKWVEQGTGPGSFSLPLAQPTATLSAITIHPLNPLRPPPGGARGLNTRYHWVGRFRPGNELWCATQGMDLACSRHQPPISYTADDRNNHRRLSLVHYPPPR